MQMREQLISFLEERAHIRKPRTDSGRSGSGKNGAAVLERAADAKISEAEDAEPTRRLRVGEEHVGEMINQT